MSKAQKYVSFYLFVCTAVIAGALLLSRISSVISVEVDAPASRKIFVIDAGHGGEDGGAVSSTGIYESHLNLQIAQRLSDLLRFLGADTRMIRTEDVSVHTEGSTIAQRKVSDIRQRVQIVKETPNAVLLSIHQNHFPQSKYRGAQVFYAKGSEALAQRIQQTIATQVDQNNHRQCKNAKDIYLMEHATCPAVLVECGFLSNPSEELLLRDGNYQKKLAAAIACGVLAYTEETNEV